MNYKARQKLAQQQARAAALRRRLRIFTGAAVVVVTGAFAANASAPTLFKVRTGDTFSGIVKRLTGNARDWNKLYDPQRSQLPDPNVILPGMRLQLVAEPDGTRYLRAATPTQVAQARAQAKERQLAAKTPALKTAQSKATPVVQAPSTPAVVAVKPAPTVAQATPRAAAPTVKSSALPAPVLPPIVTAKPAAPAAVAAAATPKPALVAQTPIPTPLPAAAPTTSPTTAPTTAPATAPTSTTRPMPVPSPLSGNVPVPVPVPVPMPTAALAANTTPALAAAPVTKPVAATPVPAPAAVQAPQPVPAVAPSNSPAKAAMAMAAAPATAAAPAPAATVAPALTKTPTNSNTTAVPVPLPPGLTGAAPVAAPTPVATSAKAAGMVAAAAVVAPAAAQMLVKPDVKLEVKADASTSPGLAAPDTLVIGVMPNINGTVLMAQYDNLKSYLERTTSQKVRIVVPGSLKAYFEATLRGDYDLAIGAPHFARLAQQDARLQPVAMFEPRTNAQLVSLVDGAMKSARDVRGKTVIFANPQSLVAMYGRQWLSQQNLEQGKDYDVKSARTDLGVGRMLLSGDAIAAVMSSGEFRALPADEAARLKIVEVIARVPNFVIMAHPRLGSERMAKIKNKLQGFLADKTEGMAFAKATGVSGIVDADEATLRELDPFVAATRRMMVPAP